MGSSSLTNHRTRVRANSLQSCPTLCNPMDYSQTGSSSVRGILQATILEWAAMTSARGSSQPRDGAQVSYVPALAGGLFTTSTIWEAQLNFRPPHWEGRVLTTGPPGCGSFADWMRHVYWVGIRSVAQSCLTLCDAMNPSTPGLPIHHQLPEFTQTHVHRVSDPEESLPDLPIVPLRKPHSGTAARENPRYTPVITR